MAIAYYYDEPFEGKYLILALIVFSLTFPGAVYSAGSLTGLVREVILNWFIVLVILLFFGYASGYLSLFPARMVVAWSVGVPILLALTHATLPVLLPRVLAIEGMRRNAVLAGASELGAKLASADHRCAADGSPTARCVRRPPRRAAHQDRRIAGARYRSASWPTTSKPTTST